MEDNFALSTVVINTHRERGVLTINFALVKIYSVLVMLSDVCSSFYDANCQNVIVREYVKYNRTIKFVKHRRSAKYFNFLYGGM